MAFLSSPLYALEVTSASSYETPYDSVAIIVVVYLTVFLAIHLTHKEKNEFNKSLKEPLIQEDLDGQNKWDLILILREGIEKWLLFSIKMELNPLLQVLKIHQTCLIDNDKKVLVVGTK